MNRIYQGRVTKVEISKDGEKEPEPLDNWPQALWQRHQLFQAEAAETLHRYLARARVELGIDRAISVVQE